MPEAAVVEQPTTDTNTANNNSGAGSGESLGWRAGLPDDLKQNTDLANYKTVGDFTKDALSWKGKVGELEGKLADSIPKLTDDASEEDRATYYEALGRPTKPEEYEFDGEDKNAPEWTAHWKNTFHGLGFTKAQAKQLSVAFNGQMKQLVDAHNAAIAAESAQAQTALKAKYGDKYDTNVELAKRMWQKHGKEEFDKVFADGTGANRYAMIDFLLSMAALTGEDTSPQAGGLGAPKKGGPEGLMSIYKPVKL